MEHQVRNLTALGLLVLVAGAIFIWGFFFLMGDPLLSGGDEVVVVMEDGAGLNRGDRVQLHGVQVGSVRRVELQAPNRVHVKVKVDAGVRLPADTRAVSRVDVFGATTVDLVPGGALVMLQGGDTIRGFAQKGLPDLATELGDQARVLMASADSLLSPAAVSDLRATASVLPATAQQLQSAFSELTAAAASLRRMAEELERAQAGAGAGETLVEVQASARAATAALTTMDRSLASLASVMEKVDSGHGSLGRLVNDTTLYGELSAALREVRELTADVKENPRRYLTFRVF
jgi:phospholipid/cholesterol/gamma-HCH transport system substrate-binding protein